MITEEANSATNSLFNYSPTYLTATATKRFFNLKFCFRKGHKVNKVHQQKSRKSVDLILERGTGNLMLRNIK